MRTIVDGVGGIDETTQGIAHAVYEQSQATDEIAHGAREVADGIGQVNQSMALILSSNDESGKIAGELFDIFEVLVKGWSDLDDRMKSFAREVSRL